MRSIAALVVLSLQSVPSLALGLGLGYIAVFGVGSMIGMALLSATLVVPLKLSANHAGRLRHALGAALGAGSFGFGAFIVWNVGLVGSLLAT